MCEGVREREQMSIKSSNNNDSTTASASPTMRKHSHLLESRLRAQNGMLPSEMFCFQTVENVSLSLSPAPPQPDKAASTSSSYFLMPAKCK